MNTRHSRTLVVILGIVTALVVGVAGAQGPQPAGSESLSGPASVSGGCPVGTGYDPGCDVTQDGTIDVVDVQRLGARWGATGTFADDSWRISGNSAATGDFLGTTNSQPLVLKTNSVERLRVDTSGNVGVGTTSPTQRLTVDGNTLLLGADDPVARGYTTTNLSQPQSVFVSGKMAYVASIANDSLSVFDVSDPDNIVARGSIATNLDGPKSVFVSGRYAYVANAINSRLAVFDVSDPVNIVALGYTSTNLSSAYSVYVSGKYAYVASSGNDRLAIFDISDPNTIVARDFISTYLDAPYSVYVSGKYAYVASENNDRLVIFDVSDPADIVALAYTNANLDAPFSISAFVAGQYAYVLNRINNRLAVFDVSDPDAIVARGYTSTNMDGPWSVFVSGNHAYTVSYDNDRLAVFDVNNLESPTLATGNLRTGHLDVADNAIINNSLYVGGGLGVGPNGALIDGELSVAGTAPSTIAGSLGLGRQPATNKLEVEGTASKTAAGDWLANSDARIKTGVRDLDHPLAVIDRLRPVRFRYTDAYRVAHPSIRDVEYYNYIAQEFREVFPDFVYDSGEDGLLQIDGYPASVYAVGAIQELHQMLQEKDAEIVALKADAARQQQQIAELAARLAALEAGGGGK
jgi:hypothetical protein